MEAPTGIEVVLRFRDGHTTRGVLTREFTPRDSAVEAETDSGETLRINISELKAVFFLKDPRRRDAELQGAVTETAAGAQARVEFFDGEVIDGRVAEYTVEDAGFFLYPTSQGNNNDKVFVVAQALQTLSLEG